LVLAKIAGRRGRNGCPISTVGASSLEHTEEAICLLFTENPRRSLLGNPYAAECILM
jgi:hypothetical protein